MRNLALKIVPLGQRKLYFLLLEQRCQTWQPVLWSANKPDLKMPFEFAQSKSVFGMLLPLLPRDDDDDEVNFDVLPPSLSAAPGLARLRLVCDPRSRSLSFVVRVGCFWLLAELASCCCELRNKELEPRC